jgi:hypothetical protein
VLVAARYYLHQPQVVLLAHLANELVHGRTALRKWKIRSNPCSTPRVASVDPDATDVLARVEDEPTSSPSEHRENPGRLALHFTSGTLRAGRLVHDHGGVGMIFLSPLPRCAPTEDEDKVPPSSGPSSSVIEDASSWQP